MHSHSQPYNNNNNNKCLYCRSSYQTIPMCVFFVVSLPVAAITYCCWCRCRCRCDKHLLPLSIPFHIDDAYFVLFAIYFFFAISIRTFSIHHYSGWTLMETNELMRSLNQFRLRRTLAPFCISLEDNSNSLEWMIQRQIAFERSHKPRDLYPNYRKHLPNTQRSTTVHFSWIYSIEEM